MGSIVLARGHLPLAVGKMLLLLGDFSSRKPILGIKQQGGTVSGEGLQGRR
jgi:hypothetical protein